MIRFSIKIRGMYQSGFYPASQPKTSLLPPVRMLYRLLPSISTETKKWQTASNGGWWILRSGALSGDTCGDDWERLYSTGDDWDWRWLGTPLQHCQPSADLPWPFLPFVIKSLWEKNSTRSHGIKVAFSLWGGSYTTCALSFSLLPHTIFALRVAALKA
jgi:hypothetical protein